MMQGIQRVNLDEGLVKGSQLFSEYIYIYTANAWVLPGPAMKTCGASSSSSPSSSSSSTS
jgi:hypothetical protein